MVEDDGKPKDESVPQGKETNKPVEDTAPNTEADKEPLSLYDKTEAIVTRQEAANKKTEELLERQEKLFANQRLAGTGGGHIETEPKKLTDIEYAESLQKGEVNPMKEDGLI